MIIKTGKSILPKVKWGKSHTVLITLELEQPLKDYARHCPERIGIQSDTIFTQNDGSPLSRDGIFQRVQRIGRDAKVKVHPHALRRYRTTSFLWHGLDIHLVKDAMGHKNIATTMLYVKTTKTDLTDAMKKLGLLQSKALTQLNIP